MAYRGCSVRPLLLGLLLLGSDPEQPQPLARSPLEVLYLAVDVPLIASTGWKSTWDPNGPRLAVGDRGYSGWKKGIHIISLGQTLREEEFAGTPMAKDPAWSPDGKWIAFVEDQDNDRQKEEVWIAAVLDGDKTFRVARGGFPFWPLAPDQLYYHDRTAGAIFSVRVAGQDPGTAGFEAPHLEFLFQGRCLYPMGSSGKGLIGSWDSSWVRVLDVRHLLEWPVTLSGTTILANLGNFTCDAAFFIHGSDRVSNQAGLDMGLWATSVYNPGERFLLWREHGARPSVSADGKWLAYDREEVGADRWTRLVPLTVHLERMERSLRESALEDREVLDPIEAIVAFLRFRSPRMDPRRAFLDLMGKEAAGDSAVARLAELIFARLALNAGEDSLDLERKARDLLNAPRSDRPMIAAWILLQARRLLADVLVARGDFRACAVVLAEAAREDRGKELWRKALWTSIVAKDRDLAREALEALRKGSSSSPFSSEEIDIVVGLRGEAAAPPAMTAPPVNRAKFLICARRDGKAALQVLSESGDTSQSAVFFRSWALLLSGEHAAALQSLKIQNETRGAVLQLALLDLLGRNIEGIELARELSRTWWPSEGAAYPLGYLLRHGMGDEVRSFLDEKGSPILASTLLGAVARMVSSNSAVPEALWPDIVPGVPDLPTAPIRALDLARRGLEVPPVLLEKALRFARRMELTYSRVADRLVSPIPSATMVALTCLAGFEEEAAWRLDLAIRTGEDPFLLWLHPDIILLGDRPLLLEIFEKYGLPVRPQSAVPAEKAGGSR